VLVLIVVKNGMKKDDVGEQKSESFLMPKDANISMKRMLTPNKIVQTLEEHKGEIRKYEVKQLGLFGSVLKGREKKGSDLDFLVSFRKATFDNYMELKFFLERLFHRKVDLVMESSLKPALKYVKEEALYVRGL
jgi:hypothetical protein